MNPFPHLVRLVLCVVLLTGAARADDDSKAFHWLTREEALALVTPVPPPPAPDSVEDKADLAKVVQAQTSRTAAVEAECKRDQTFSYKLFDSVYGTTLTPENSPKFFALLDHVTSATKFINDTAKEKFHRPRPYLGHPETVKALFNVTGFSYPSGHSMGSFTLATVLAAVFPDKKQALQDRAAQIALSRVQAGVHYPSDIAQGQVLGRATGEAIVANDKFQADLAAVKEELAGKK